MMIFDGGNLKWNGRETIKCCYKERCSYEHFFFFGGVARLLFEVIIYIICDFHIVIFLKGTIIKFTKNKKVFLKVRFA